MLRRPNLFCCRVLVKVKALFILKFPLILDDHSRVKLQNTENDYINASLVVIEEAQRCYILTQVSHQSVTNQQVLQGMQVWGKWICTMVIYVWMIPHHSVLRISC